MEKVRYKKKVEMIYKPKKILTGQSDFLESLRINAIRIAAEKQPWCGDEHKWNQCVTV